MLARRIDLVPERIRTQIAFLRAWSLLEIMRAVEAEARHEPHPAPPSAASSVSKLDTNCSVFELLRRATSVSPS